ncbi:MAG: hypothetical protein R2854_06510 [Caldilineaceae bacterium]
MLEAQSAYFTELDQAVGDGDMGITMGKIGVALQAYAAETPVDARREAATSASGWPKRGWRPIAGPSTMGTLLATALMRGQGSARQDRAHTRRPGDHVPGCGRGHAGAGQGQARRQDHPRRHLPRRGRAFAAAVADHASLAAAGGIAVDEARPAVTPSPRCAAASAAPAGWASAPKAKSTRGARCW